MNGFGCSPILIILLGIRQTQTVHGVNRQKTKRKNEKEKEKKKKKSNEGQIQIMILSFEKELKHCPHLLLFNQIMS